MKKTTVEQFDSGLLRFRRELVQYDDIGEGLTDMAKASRPLPDELVAYADDIAREVFQAHGLPLNPTGRWMICDGGHIEIDVSGSGPGGLYPPGRGSRKIERFRDCHLWEKRGDALGSPMYWACRLANAAMMLRAGLGDGLTPQALFRAFEIGELCERLLRLTEPAVEGKTVDEIAMERLAQLERRRASQSTAQAAAARKSLADKKRQAARILWGSGSGLSRTAVAKEVAKQFGADARSTMRTIRSVFDEPGR